MATVKKRVISALDSLCARPWHPWATDRSRSIAVLRQAMESMGLSVYHCIVKTTRIADLHHNTAVTSSHIAEAVRYRGLERTVG